MPVTAVCGTIRILMDTAGLVITLEALAKINLTLEVLGKRPDGYHALRSVVMPVSLSDTVTLTRTYAQVALSVTAGWGVSLTHIGPTERNLTVRAARLMQTRYKAEGGARIHIHKRIPIGGGLGGGSADAAAVIRGLNQLWDLGLSRGEMMEVGAELGSDIPALVHGGAVLMEGRGEYVTGLFQGVPPEACKGFWLVIANPGVMCPTGEVFKRWKAGLTPAPHFLHTILASVRSGHAETAAGVLFNGLQEGVYAHYPDVAQVAERLGAAGCLGVSLSGGGASVFGLVRDEAHGQEVLQRLGASLWSVLVRTCPVV